VKFFPWQPNEKHFSPKRALSYCVICALSSGFVYTISDGSGVIFALMTDYFWAIFAFQFAFTFICSAFVVMIFGGLFESSENSNEKMNIIYLSLITIALSLLQISFIYSFRSPDYPMSVFDVIKISLPFLVSFIICAVF
jgi:hypothetical protein